MLFPFNRSVQTSVLILCLLTGLKCFAQTGLSRVKRFHRETQAEASARSNASRAAVSKLHHRSRFSLLSARDRARREYAVKPPLKDYDRRYRVRVQELADIVEALAGLGFYRQGGSEWSIGHALFLARIPCPRKYDVYFVASNQGKLKLAWIPWHDLSVTDQKRINNKVLIRRKGDSLFDPKSAIAAEFQIDKSRTRFEVLFKGPTSRAESILDLYMNRDLERLALPRAGDRWSVQKETEALHQLVLERHQQRLRSRLGLVTTVTRQHFENVVRTSTRETVLEAYEVLAIIARRHPDAERTRPPTKQRLLQFSDTVAARSLQRINRSLDWSEAIDFKLLKSLAAIEVQLMFRELDALDDAES